MCLNDVRRVLGEVGTDVSESVDHLDLFVQFQQLDGVAVGLLVQDLEIRLHPLGAGRDGRPGQARHAHRRRLIDGVTDGGGRDDRVGEVGHADVQRAQIHQLGRPHVVQARELRVNERLAPLGRVQQQHRARIALARRLVQLHVDAHPPHDGDRRDVPVERLQQQNFLLQDVLLGAGAVGDVSELVELWWINLLDLRKI